MANKKKSPSATVANQKNDRFDELLKEAEFIDRVSEESLLNSSPSFGFIREEPELELGLRLKESRENERLTQGELADRTKLADIENIGITRNVISFIESGRTQPAPRDIRLLCEALRISPNFLIYGNDNPFDNLTDLHRYHGGGSDIEFQAYINYCVSKLHHHHKTIFIELMLGMLRGWHKDFDAELNKNAIPTFIKAAKELETIQEKRNKSNT